MNFISLKDVLICFLFISISVFFLMLILSTTQGVDYTWTDHSSGSKDWSNQGNWNDGASSYPDGDDDTATFDSTWDSRCTIDQPITVGSITITDDYTGEGAGIRQGEPVEVDDSGANNGSMYIGSNCIWDCYGQNLHVFRSTVVDGTLDGGEGVLIFHDILVNGTVVASSGDNTIENDLTVNSGGNFSTGGNDETWLVQNNWTLNAGALCVSTGGTARVQGNLSFDSTASFWHSDGEVRMECVYNNLSKLWPGNQTFFYLNCSGVNGTMFHNYFRVYESIKIDLQMNAFEGWDYPGDQTLHTHVLFIGNITITGGRARTETPHKWYYWPAEEWEAEYDVDLRGEDHSRQVDYASGHTYHIHGRNETLTFKTNSRPGNGTMESSWTNVYYKWYGGWTIGMKKFENHHLESDTNLSWAAGGAGGADPYSFPSFYMNNFNLTTATSFGFERSNVYDGGDLISNLNGPSIINCPNFYMGNVTTINGFDVEGNITNFYVGNISDIDHHGSLIAYNISVEGGDYAFNGELHIGGLYDLGEIYLGPGYTINFTSTNGINGDGYVIETLYQYMNTTEFVNITGVPNWYINTTEMSDWTMLYVNLSNCNNSGSQYLTYLGWNYSGNWMDDCVGPIILTNLTEGSVWNKTINPYFLVNVSAYDLSFIYDITYSIYCTTNGTLMNTSTTDWTEFGELHKYTWNTSFVDVSTWLPGNYNISIMTNDSHNPTKTKIAKGRAQNMLCDIDGEEVGHKREKKESKEKPAKQIRFKRFSGTDIFTIEFMVNKTDTKHDVKWRTYENNFKLGFGVKLPKDQDAVRFMLSADAVTYLPGSNFHGHFVIGKEKSYFFDLEDFHLAKGSIDVSKKTRENGNESYTITLRHSSWGKTGGWVYIDPLAGSVNTGELEINWTLVVAPTIVFPVNNSVISNQRWTNLIVSVSDIQSLTANITFYDAENDTVIGTSSTIGDGTLSINWTGLAWNHADYSWYATCEILGFNGTSPTYHFSTSTNASSSTIYSPPSGSGGGGKSVEEEESAESNRGIVIALSAALILALISVWAFMEFFEEGIHK